MPGSTQRLVKSVLKCARLQWEWICVVLSFMCLLLCVPTRRDCPDALRSHGWRQS